MADHTEPEAHQLIFCQLSLKMQSDLLREQSKRRDNRPWVSIAIPKGQQLPDVLEAFEEYLGRRLPSHEPTRNGCIVKCNDEGERDELLRLNGFGIDNLPVEVNRHEYEMTADDIFAFFLKRLRTDHECQTTRKSYGLEDEDSQAKTPTKVKIAAVENRPASPKRAPEPAPNNKGRNEEKKQPEPAKGKGKGKGGDKPKADASPKESNPLKENAKRDSPPKNRHKFGVCTNCKNKGLEADHDWRLCCADVPQDMLAKVSAQWQKTKDKMQAMRAKKAEPAPSQ